MTTHTDSSVRIDVKGKIDVRGTKVSVFPKKRHHSAITPKSKTQIAYPAMIKLVWSNDKSLPLASKYLQGYSNQHQDYAYRVVIIKIEENSFIKNILQ